MNMQGIGVPFQALVPLLLVHLIERANGEETYCGLFRSKKRKVTLLRALFAYNVH